MRLQPQCQVFLEAPFIPTYKFAALRHSARVSFFRAQAYDGARAHA
jgi:hypothetical protein